jgi:uncharacterized protein
MNARAPLRVVLPGGSGQVGGILARHFHAKGENVVVLSRSVSQAPWRVVPWDGTSLGAWTLELEAADLVINLAGRSVNCRYGETNRREIRESRTQTTALLGEVISGLAKPPRIWMNASTATIYRHALDHAMDERTGEIGGGEANAPDTWRFSIDVATSWEKTFFDAKSPNTRKIALRSAMVMSPDRGGVFDKLLRLVRLGLGGRSGSGGQFASWIHEMDFVRAVEFLISHEEIDGAVNLASPGPLPNREFMAALRQAWGQPIGLPATEWMLEIGAVLLGTETELILKSRRVVPGRLLEAGFQFEFPDWRRAAEDLTDQKRSHASLAYVVE